MIMMGESISQIWVKTFILLPQFISAAFEYKAMELVFYYINLKYNKDVRLAFEALRVGES